MSITEFFTRLGAPLRNAMWSCGSVRIDGTVFLRAWQDRTKAIDGVKCLMVSHSSKRAHVGNVGYDEHQRHIELIHKGAPSFMVLCIAQDSTGRPRKIASYIRDRLFKCGRLFEGDDGNLYLENLGPVPFKDLHPN